MKEFRRPNVLIIYTDQQRYDTLRCNGNSRIVSPYLDSLASNGARLSNKFVQSPVCMPSRMSMLTGRYCSSLGIGSNGIPFDESTMIPINNLLKPYGYNTAQIGKLHFDPHSNRNHKNPTSTYGFDTFILSDEPGCYDDAYTKWVESINPDELKHTRISLPPAAEYRGEKSYSNQPRETHEPYEYKGSKDFTHSSFVASETCKYIRQNKDRLFFAIAGFYAPHTPVNPPKEFIDLYNINDIPSPIVDSEDKVMHNLKNVSNDDWKKVKLYYYALVSHVDDCIGQIIKTLKEEGLFEDTIIVFTSDHGEYLGDHGRIQKGMPAEDCISKVPTIITYPKKIKPNTVINLITESVDIAPTILDFCGVQIPQFVQGKSMKNLLQGKTDEHKEAALTEYFDTDKFKAACIRTKKFRYYFDDSGNEVLFDIEDDKNETTNVISDVKYVDDLSSLRKLMMDKMLAAGYSRMDKFVEY